MGGWIVKVCAFTVSEVQAMRAPSRGLWSASPVQMDAVEKLADYMCLLLLFNLCNM